MVDGEPIGQWEIEVDVDGIGKFTITFEKCCRPQNL
jgi:hypothetical protein